MKSFILLLVFMVLCPVLLTADKEADFFEKAEELSYEGQIKSAQKLIEGKAEEGKTEAGKATIPEGWDDTSMMLGMVWGAIGTGFFIYGKKQSKAMYLMCGIGLCIVPIFVSNTLYNAIFGTVLTILPFKVEI